MDNMNWNLLSDSNYCRLCGEQNKNGTYLYSSDENSVSLSTLINKYLPIKVENDNTFPSSVCPGCHIQLEATKLFMDLIVEGQAKLRNIYRTQKEMHRQEKKRQQLQEVLHTVSSQSIVQTYGMQSDDTGDKYLIEILSDGPLFPPDHELSLRAQGLEKPKRKRGRPPKTVRASENTVAYFEVQKDHPIDDCVKEVAVDDDGPKRRKVKAPTRFEGLVQGEELERILKEEGVIDACENSSDDVSTTADDETVIGRTETENGEDLGVLVFNSKPKFRTKRGIPKRKSTKKYQCEICKRDFLRYRQYRVHQTSHTFQYVCQTTDCNFKNRDKTLIETHQTESGQSGITTVENIVSPDQQHNTEDPFLENPANFQHQCTKCDKSFDSKQTLDVHKRTVHNQEKPFNCDKCSKSFSYANSLRFHLLKHSKLSPSRQYPCDICGKVLRHPSSLNYHRESEHSNGRRFICNKCDKSFKHRQLLQRHQLVHSNERPFSCTNCSASFKTQANLLNHETVHTGEKKYSCNQCEQTFAHRTSLTLHLRWHEGHKPYTCDFCNKLFSQKGNLAEHMRIHTGEKPYCCKNCGRSFTTSSQFNLHMKRHTGERPWVCEYCPKTFLHKDTFKTHVRRHLNNRMFKCKHCTRAFIEPYALKRHLRIHTGEKPYTCEECGKTFSDSSNKQKHMRTHNTSTDENVLSEIPSPPGSKKSSRTSKPSYTRKSVGNRSSLFHIFDRSMTTIKSKKKTLPDFQLTQLFDQQGSPISITTRDGQTVPIVTMGDNENSIQGLLPDGTLVPINIGAAQVENTVQDMGGNKSNLLNLEIEAGMDILAPGEMLKDRTTLDANIQLLTGGDGQEVCLVTYAIDENSEMNQELVLDSLMIQT